MPRAGATAYPPAAATAVAAACTATCAAAAAAACSSCACSCCGDGCCCCWLCCESCGDCCCPPDLDPCCACCPGCPACSCWDCGGLAVPSVRASLPPWLPELASVERLLAPFQCLLARCGAGRGGAGWAGWGFGAVRCSAVWPKPQVSGWRCRRDAVAAGPPQAGSGYGLREERAAGAAVGRTFGRELRSLSSFWRRRSLRRRSMSRQLLQAARTTAGSAARDPAAARASPACW